MIDDGRFPMPSEDLRLYKRLATMVSNAPLGKIPNQVPDWRGAAAVTRQWELKLSERLELIAAAR